ncbi:MAG: CAP domain-containing protein [Acidobacteriia bacterium]|nr:CAP domain-containing protein [Terriglobia bacterium]
MRLCCVLLLALVLLLAGWHRPAASRPRADEDDPLGPLARKVFALANRQRRLHGVHELEWSEALAEPARRHSMDMMRSGFFSHTDLAGSTPGLRLRAASISWSRCGENIFREHGMDDPADAAIEGWMRSPSHRQSLLDPLFTQTGVGIAISPDTDYFITQELIRPLK